jgi:hypothetical protein
MTLQELQKQALQLPISDRWQLVQTLLESLKQETHPMSQQRNLSRLRGIAKSSVAAGDTDSEEDYVTYLTEKYQ